VGNAIVFPSYIAHRVLPITSGMRQALVAWIHGPAFR
jgi:PKHD-type hydroxylase